MSSISASAAIAKIGVPSRWSRSGTRPEMSHSLSAEVSPLPPAPTDIRGYILHRRELVYKATHILISPTSDPFSDLSDYLHSLSLSLTPDEASQILKSLKNLNQALAFFRFCPSLSSNFPHDYFTYNRLFTETTRTVRNGGMESASLVSPSESPSQRLWTFLVSGLTPHEAKEAEGRQGRSQSKRDWG